MALIPWIDFSNGDSLLNIRTQLNSFNTEVNTQVDQNTADIAANEVIGIQNDNDIAQNAADIVTNADAITALEADPDTLPFVPQVIAPTFQEGQMYYDLNTGALKVQGHVEGVEIAVGHNMHVHVVNNTGAIIEKGSVCRQNGIAGGHIQAIKAIATSFQEATIFGVAQIDIPIGGEGALMTFGELSPLDTAGLPTGVPLYLSDTVAGGLTPTQPDIATQVGGCLTADATDGRLFISTVNTKVFPTIFGSMAAAVLPTTIPASLITYTPITSWQPRFNRGITPNETNGTFLIPMSGVYRVNTSMYMDFDNVGGAGKKELWFAFRDVTTGSVYTEGKSFILKDAETHDFHANALGYLTAGHEYRLELKSEIELTNVAYTAISFDITSVDLG